MCGIAGLMTRDGSPPADAVLDRLASAWCTVDRMAKAGT